MADSNDESSESSLKGQYTSDEFFMGMYHADRRRRALLWFTSTYISYVIYEYLICPYRLQPISMCNKEDEWCAQHGSSNPDELEWTRAFCIEEAGRGRQWYYAFTRVHLSAMRIRTVLSNVIFDYEWFKREMEIESDEQRRLDFAAKVQVYEQEIAELIIEFDALPLNQVHALDLDSGAEGDDDTDEHEDKQMKNENNPKEVDVPELTDDHDDDDNDVDDSDDCSMGLGFE